MPAAADRRKALAKRQKLLEKRASKSTEPADTYDEKNPEEPKEFADAHMPAHSVGVEVNKFPLEEAEDKIERIEEWSARNPAPGFAKASTSAPKQTKSVLGYREAAGEATGRAATGSWNASVLNNAISIDQRARGSGSSRKYSPPATHRSGRNSYNSSSFTPPVKKMLKQEEPEIGDIIMAPLHEPDGLAGTAEGADRTIEDMKSVTSSPSFGQIYSKNRPMAVVGLYSEHYVCVPAYTFRGVGTAEKVNREEFISYWHHDSYVHEPYTAEDKQSTRDPLVVKLWQHGRPPHRRSAFHAAAPISRPYTVPACVIGTLAPESLTRLLTVYNFYAPKPNNPSTPHPHPNGPNSKNQRQMTSLMMGKAALDMRHRLQAAAAEPSGPPRSYQSAHSDLQPLVPPQQWGAYSQNSYRQPSYGVDTRSPATTNHWRATNRSPSESEQSPRYQRGPKSRDFKESKSPGPPQWDGPSSPQRAFHLTEEQLSTGDREDNEALPTASVYWTRQHIWNSPPPVSNSNSDSESSSSSDVDPQGSLSFGSNSVPPADVSWDDSDPGEDPVEAARSAQEYEDCFEYDDDVPFVPGATVRININHGTRAPKEWMVIDSDDPIAQEYIQMENEIRRQNREKSQKAREQRDKREFGKWLEKHELDGNWYFTAAELEEIMRQDRWWTVGEYDLLWTHMNQEYGDHDLDLWANERIVVEAQYQKLVDEKERLSELQVAKDAKSDNESIAGAIPGGSGERIEEDDHDLSVRLDNMTLLITNKIREVREVYARQIAALETKINLTMQYQTTRGVIELHDRHWGNRQKWWPTMPGQTLKQGEAVKYWSKGQARAKDGDNG